MSKIKHTVVEGEFFIKVEIEVCVEYTYKNYFDAAGPRKDQFTIDNVYTAKELVDVTDTLDEEAVAYIKEIALAKEHYDAD